MAWLQWLRARVGDGSRAHDAAADAVAGAADPEATTTTDADATDTDVGDTADEPIDMEPVLAAMVTQSQLLNNRLTRLEDRFDELVGADQGDADRQVVLELRLRSARLSAELARVTAQLRGRLEARAARDAPALESGSISIIDLTARPEYEPRSGGWQRVSNTDT